MAKKTYKIGAYELDWWARVEIDFDHTFEYGNQVMNTEMAIKMMVEFWSGWQWKLKDNHNDYTLLFLKNLTAEIIGEIAANNYSMYGLQSHFRDAEGWCQMDGSAGIEIVGFDNFLWSENFDFDVQEVKG